jgi:hypothetical protein
MPCAQFYVRFSNELAFTALYGTALFDLAVLVCVLGGIVYLSSEFLP